MLFLLISFIAGVLTILAPCILPLLPVIVGHSLADSTLSKRRAFVVILSLGLSVIVFTLILKVSTLFVNIPQNFWTYISGGIIFIFGVVMIFPALWDRLSFLTNISTSSNKVLMQGYQKNSIWGDVIVGASLGPIFSACSPTYFVILATVLPVSPVVGIVYLLTYTIGLCLALLVVVLIGQRIMTRLNIVADSHGYLKKIFGVIFILVSLAILSGYDKKFQISILDAGFFDVTKVEQNLLKLDNSQNGNTEPEEQQNSDAADTTTKNPNTKFLTLKQKSAKFTLAPEISTPDGFVNMDGQPVTIGEFRGKKVVLLDIWTYSCINCQRTIPYLNDWYSKYKDQGLEIIGLHTPEFSFERVLSNVENAVKNLNIKYPVVLDNDFSTWNALHNQYWPRKYLIDIDGYIVYDHAGEGDYDGTEHKIQDALAERDARLGITAAMPEGVVVPKDAIDFNAGQVGSPEVYFGSARNEYLANGAVGASGAQNLTLPTSFDLNNLYLDGSWNFTSEYAENTGEASVVFKYKAKNVYMVASADIPADVEVYLDGKLVSTISIKDEMLYPLIKGTDYSTHTLMLKVKKSGLKAFTFTFG